jgi:hypothetical protein
MADLNIATGTKLRVAYDAPTGKDPEFNMVCTFFKAMDESAFLISIPIVNGKPLEAEEDRKLLIRHGEDENQMILAGYVDDIIKQGIRRYWKIRRVTEQRTFFQRADERLKVALRITYTQDSWPVNAEGVIPPDDGLTLDVSAGGMATYLNHNFAVGEMINTNLPRLGTSAAGQAIDNIVSMVCWSREAPKGSPFRFTCGVQFRFADGSEKDQIAQYIANVKKMYKL